MKHITQPTGHSCGPTCIKIIVNEILEQSPTIEELCEICGTDWEVGTPPDRMKIGLDYLGIKYLEHIDEKFPFESLRESIDRGSYCIVRTIMGLPHWILITKYGGNKFIVNDPSSRELRYLDEGYLDRVWKVRNYFYFEIYL